ncbi:N-acetylated-alpha-linked acidic dipeptidase 2-like [Ptychodera flava]|uniref:N-acetylated-alpha-linked acidic dipeptidase 2-like n=1 Tax=Ptychodera flava TaxID=63121 RepID=UPI00396A8CDC
MSSNYHLIPQNVNTPFQRSSGEVCDNLTPLLPEEGTDSEVGDETPPSSFCGELQILHASPYSQTERFGFIMGFGTGRYPMRYYWIATAVLAAVALAIGLLIGFLAAPSGGGETPGNPPTERPPSETYQAWLDALKGEDEWVTEKLLEVLDAKKIEEHLRSLTRVPNLAGTSVDKDTAYYVRDEFNKYGLDSVEVVPYEVLLSYPDIENPNYVYVLNSDGEEEFKSQAFEKALTPEENRTDIVPPFNAYAVNGDVEGQLVYVNYARLEDFLYLERNLSVNITGKIVISRYGKIYRGDKSNHAEMFGAAGLILYSDPADYAVDSVTDVYPDTWWLPGSGVQRGTLFLDIGDPLTPGYPSLDTAFREEEEDIRLPKIPVHPIGYDDALKLLEQIGGTRAPDSWQGKMDLTYNIGPEMKDNKTVRLEVNNVNQKNYTYTTIGYIKGSLEPDRYVILGNHRDAWVFGSLDPSSGTACMLELARAFKILIDEHGWRPRRTIVFCSWGAEEYGLIGSNEWIEENIKALSKKAVLYMNVDTAVQGNHVFRARSSPALYKAIYDATKKVTDPSERSKSVFENWIDKSPGSDGQPSIGTLGAGSDYASFMDLVGISALDFRYTYDSALGISSYPLYHSMYETFHLAKGILDPDFEYHLAVTQVWAELARSFADSLILPFNCEDYGIKMEESMDEIKRNSEAMMKERGFDLDNFYTALEEYKEAAKNFHAYIDNLETVDPFEVRSINDKLMYLERSFIDPLGLPDRLLNRHVVFAPSSKNTYFGDAFPGLLDGMFDIDNLGEPEATEQWKLVEKHVSVLTYFVHGAAKTLKEVFQDG